MVDTRHLKCLAERHTGSTPVLGTNQILGCSQVVRHETLTLACTGPNPVAPAIRAHAYFFLLIYEKIKPVISIGFEPRKSQVIQLSQFNN